MEYEKVEIIRRHVIHYACGCTTTRIETNSGNATLGCAGHDAKIVKEELSIEYNPSGQKGRPPSNQQHLQHLQQSPTCPTSPQSPASPQGEGTASSLTFDLEELEFLKF